MQPAPNPTAQVVGRIAEELPKYEMRAPPSSYVGPLSFLPLRYFFARTIFPSLPSPAALCNLTCSRMRLAGHLLLCSSTSLLEPMLTCWSKKLVIGHTCSIKIQRKQSKLLQLFTKKDKHAE